MKKLGNKIKKILSISQHNFEISLEFEDGFVGAVSLSHIFGTPVGMSAEVLKGQLFEKCFVDSGALAWPNGYELCPDQIRLWIEVRKSKMVRGTFL